MVRWHRALVGFQLALFGIVLRPDEVIHHRDRNKHHNCFLFVMCRRCREKGFSNLEVLDRAKHSSHYYEWHHADLSAQPEDDFEVCEVGGVTF